IYTSFSNNETNVVPLPLLQIFYIINYIFSHTSCIHNIYYLLCCHFYATFRLTLVIFDVFFAKTIY
ncbi:MAG: hypothetical protein LBV47_08875, partial [Bacteroidales bacterium]|nr:hypothetical protein [Bacteroidales bacterium]